MQIFTEIYFRTQIKNTHYADSVEKILSRKIS